jgi:HK97 family phage major capsid protein
MSWSTRQRPVYSFDGRGDSFVRDAWAVRHPSQAKDPEGSQRRLNEFNTFQLEARQAFTTVSTSNASQIVPPGYEPLLASFTQDRPLYAAATKGDITDGTAFVLPGQVTDSGVDSAVGTQSEGSNRTDNAAPVFTPSTVTPAGITGLFRVTRELVDASNPAIDAVALSELRESYGRQTEARIFTELNTVQSGTITGLQVPNGAQARTSTGTGLPADLRKAILDFGGIRGMRPRNVVASMRQSVAEGLDGLDASTVGAGEEYFFVTHGCPVYLSPQISGVAAGDGDVFVLGSGDLWAWSSGLLQFQYYERQGPGMVDLSVWGYFAAKVVNPRGVSSIRHT